MKSKRNKYAIRAPLTAGVLVAASVLAVVVQPHAAFAASTVTVNGSTTYQQVAGFGASESFGQADTIMNAASATQQQALSLLYSPTAGAGLTILRNEIPSDSGGTIEPTAPSSPTAAPTYRALGNDEGQEWLAKQAQSYGVSDIFADAWGAPPFMKTNDSDDNGGTLCGVPSATCSSGDWRQAYANYLVQYAKDYQADGINLSYIGFENEANLSPDYSGMTLTPSQTANFADVVGPTLAASGLPTKLECCAAEGWNYAASYTSAITSDPVADSYVQLITSHGYTQAPTTPLATGGQPVWETEWSTFDSWDPAWDDNSDASGFTWAQNILTGLTAANLSAFLYWWGSSTPSSNGDNESLIQINGNTVSTSGRLWAFANFSRYIKPGATRIGTTTADGNLDLTAFKNPGGSVAIVALNTSTSTDSTSYSLQNTGISSGTATPYLTNASSDTATQAAIPVSAGTFSASIPARSLVTYVIPAGGGGTTPPPTTPPPSSAPPTTPPPTTTPPSATCTVSYTTSSQWTGGFTASIVIGNTGTSNISNWTLGFVFPGDQKVTNAWNTALTQSGETVSATNLSYNGAISPGGTTSLGFQGTWTNSDAPPTAFTINGSPCSG
jgi:O-glycosyl hydrolase